ncbi:MAG: hypothetical protein IJJ10_16615 [Bacillus sp. (in: Bacteria)]|uniref:hypothetical protein n=1 Tax=Niallia TaxID=2837506 RepID=UPI0003329872|nr:hypothetical protein [Niallia alba]EOR21424.1 hypothetical protein A499_23327 [Niallia nealsonii AAU1]MBQ6449056.1 hypothetical protein [Bacillus sp. (in: firmicutes)]MDU1847462.1 hypothetical protein [Niallia nealsonii]MED3795169.1 hypothetical protein [Niallia alba]
MDGSTDSLDLTNLVKKSLKPNGMFAVTCFQGSHDILTPIKIKELLLGYIPHVRLMKMENYGTGLFKRNHLNLIELQKIVSRYM